ncbi:MAG: hypothetical protein LBI74_04045 [Synergistaceae bacterium]|nr:hypothetical protein [Synergistaceae bacterium]
MDASRDIREHVSSMVAFELERGIETVRRPFGGIARRLGMDEPEVLRVALGLRHSGFIRYFGPFLDFRRLGGRGYLFGLKLPRERREEFVSYVCGLPFVTHSYLRDHRLDLWFTAILDGDSSAGTFCGTLQEAGIEFIALSAERRIKLRTSFALGGMHASAGASDAVDDRPEDTWSVRSACRLNAEQSRLIAALQDNIDLIPRPFARVARAMRTSEDLVVTEAARLKSDGVLRRIGASIDHRRAGYLWNSLTAWNLSGVSDEQAAVMAGRAAATRPWVSHCYLRRVIFSNILAPWPYNLYIMIHARDESEMAERELLLRRDLSWPECVSLRTLGELKKIPYRYIPENTSYTTSRIGDGYGERDEKD